MSTTVNNTTDHITELGYDKYVRGKHWWTQVRFFIACKLFRLTHWVGGEAFSLFTCYIQDKLNDEFQSVLSSSPFPIDRVYNDPNRN